MPAYPPLSAETFYHVYHRGNDGLDIFLESRNYHFFLERYRKHVSPVADTFAYCLMRNHFHFLIRIKSEEEWPSDKIPERRVGDLLNSYAKAFNKAHNRSGSLFQKKFRRVEITTQKQLEAVVCYIHKNPQTHGVVDDFRDYPYSSYQRLLSDEPTALLKDEVLAWFGSRDGFIEAHISDIRDFEN